MNILGPINEGTSGRYASALTDETGAGIDGAALDSATLTYYDALTLAVINGRSAQNVKNTNGVTISALGALVWAVAPADTVMVGSGAMEDHVALFTFTWGGGGAKACTHDVTIRVRNLKLVP